MDKKLLLLTFLLVLIPCAAVFSQSTEAKPDCQFCESMKFDFPPEVQFGKIASIKTYNINMSYEQKYPFAREGETWRKIYNSEDNKEAKDSLIDDGRILVSEISFTIDDKILMQSTFDERGNLDVKTEYEYNDQGNAIVVKTTSPNKGLVVKRIEALTDFDLASYYTVESANGIISKCFVEYNEDQTVDRIVKQTDDHIQTQTYTYTYDDIRNLIKRTIADSNMRDNKISNFIQRESEYKYNENNCIISSTSLYGHNYTYEYDEQGCMVKLTRGFSKDDKLTGEFIFNHLRLATVKYDYSFPRMKDAPPLKIEFDYEYDEIGNWVRKTSTMKLTGESKGVVTETVRVIEYH